MKNFLTTNSDMPENPSVFHANSGFYLQDGDLIYILIANYSEGREYKI